MAVVSLDALAQRRELIDTRTELGDLKRRLRRTEKSIESLRDVLSAIPDPIEVIGEDFLIHFANRASSDRYGARIEGTAYYRTLMGRDAPPEDCPVHTSLRDRCEVRFSTVRDNMRAEVVIAPIVLSGGQHAVVRTTRPIAAAPPPAVVANEVSPAPDPGEATGASVSETMIHGSELEALREFAAIASQTLNTGRLFTRLLPAIADRLNAAAVLYYRCDDSARRFTLHGAITPNEADTPPEHLSGDDYRVMSHATEIEAPYLHIADASTMSALPDALTSFCRGAGVGAASLLPVRSAVTIHGVLLVASARANRSASAAEERLLGSLSQMVGAAIDRNHLVRTLKRNVSTLMELQRAGMEIAESDHADAVFARLSAAACRVLGFVAVRTRVLGLTLHPDGHARTLPGTFTLDSTTKAAIKLASERSIERGQMELIDADVSIRIVQGPAHEAPVARVRTVTILPLHLGERIHGVIQLFSPHTREDIIAMKPVLRTLADHAAAALHQCERVAALDRQLEDFTGHENMAAAVLQEIDRAVMIVDGAGRIVESNRAMREMLGVGSSPMPALRDIVFSGENPDGVADYELAQGLFGQAPLCADECHITTINGKRLSVEMNVRRVGITPERLLITFTHTRLRVEMSSQQEAAMAVDDIPTLRIDSQAPANPADLPMSGTQRGSVLVIDDEPAVLDLLEDILTCRHHRVTAVSDASHALASLAEQEYDCIVFDLHMPEMDGRSFAELIAEHHPEMYGRIVFATGDAPGDGADAFLRRTGIPCIEKPFAADKVHSAVQRILARREQAA